MHKLAALVVSTGLIALLAAHALDAGKNIQRERSLHNPADIAMNMK